MKFPVVERETEAEIVNAERKKPGQRTRKVFKSVSWCTVQYIGNIKQPPFFGNKK